MTVPRILVYLLRRDLRVADNPVLHEIADTKAPPWTHLLPVYVFPAQQIEVSGSLSDSSAKCPFPEARSNIGKFWRTGPHRVKFIAESVWALKDAFEAKGSGLVLRAGLLASSAKELIEVLEKDESSGQVHGVWMTSEEGTEEKAEEREVRNMCKELGKEFRLFSDEKYLVDE